MHLTIRSKTIETYNAWNVNMHTRRQEVYKDVTWYDQDVDIGRSMGLV